MTQHLTTEVVSEPVVSAGSPPTERRRPWHSSAVLVFILVQVGAFIFYLWLARRIWFYRDDWEFLAGRNLSVHDLLRQHGGHMIALHLIVYRTMYFVVGLRSYLPYQVLSIGLHLTLAGVLFAVMRRSGVRPWIATAAASLFALYGSGGQDILWGFQIEFTGALVLGLTQMLLANHDGPIERRDWFGLLAGLAALMCSGVSVAAVGVAGLATLLRRGWRAAAFHMVPLGALFLIWYVSYDTESSSTRVKHLSQLWTWVRRSTGGVFDALGQVPFVGWLIAAMLVVGFVLAWRDGSFAERRRTLSMPTAMLVGAFAFQFVTGYNRASFGPQFATSSRYLHIIGALLIPPIAIAANAIVRRRREFLPVALALFVVGIPGNLGDTTKSFPPSAYFDNYEQMLKSLPRTKLGRSAPDDLRVELVNGPWITMGWLRDAASSGRLPAPSGPSTVNQRLTNRLRLSVEQTEPAVGTDCVAVGTPIVRRFERGDEVVVRGTVQLQLLDDSGRQSSPVVYGTTFLAGAKPHMLRFVAGPNTIRVSAGGAGGQLCKVGPGGSSGS